MAQITIADATPRVQYSVGGGGSTGPFTIPWPYFSTDDIKVYVDGVLKTITTHYTISGTAVDDGFSGGTITYGSTLTSVTVTVERDVAVARTDDFPAAGIFNIATLNTTLDKIFAIMQWLETKLGRTVNRPFTSADSYSLDWPDGATTDPKVLVASSDGGLEFGATSAEIEAAATQASNAATSATAASNSASTAEGHKNTASYYAVKVDGVASGSDHSAKAWAIGGTGVTTTSSKGAAKEWATTTGGAVDASEYSAKEYAVGTTATSSKTYATKVDGAVTGSDFSSKAWAIGGTNVTTTASRGAAKEWATSTGAAVDTSEYSAKEYAVGSTVAAGSAKEWALGGGGSFTEGTAVAGGLYSARKYATDAATEAASATAYNKKWTAVTTLNTGTHNLERANVGTYYVLNASGGSITINLPTIGTGASDALDGQMFGFEVTNVDNAITIARDGDTINGAASNYTGLTAVGHVVHFIADEVAATETDNWLATIQSCNTYGAGLTQTGTTITLDLTRDQAWTGSQRATPVTDNDGAFDMNAGNNFNWTPSGADVIEFTNETAGQGGIIYLVNGSGHAITKGSEVKCDANFLSTVSAAGNYLISYYSFDGTSVVVANTLAVS